jgi:hypothetical protein
MKTKFKIFVVCCGLALAGVLSTGISFADNSPKQTGSGCSGDGICGITKNGTILIGKWYE